MAELNRRVSADGEDPRAVAEGIHVEHGCHACDPVDVKVRGGRTTHLPDRLGGSQQ
jgi:hypothetical protein